MAAEVRMRTPAGRWVVLATVLGSGMAMLDATAVNVALPRLGDDLGADFAGLQWVVNGYTLTLASLILVGGALGDRYGRRRIFLIGTVWFTVASIACGVAWSPGVLIGARLLQGVGGALLTPTSLAILQSSFAADHRGRAIGAWSGLSGIASAVGPFVGGWLVDAASWRWVFFLNVPLAVVVVWAGARHVPESRDEGASGRLDVAGATLAVGGLAATSIALIERSWPAGAAGLALLAAFVWREATARSPLLPLTMFRNVRFSATNAVTLVVYGALGMLLFLLGITLQDALDYSPLAAGAALFPVTVIMLLGSSRAGGLAQRIGPRWPMTVGPLGIAAGLALIVRVDEGRSYATGVLPALVVFGSGLALTVAPLTATVLASAEDRRAGLASAVNNTIARTASLLAVAALPLVAGFDPTADVTAEALVDGLHRASLAAAALCVLGALLSWAFVDAGALGRTEEARTAPPAGRPPGATVEEPPRR